MKYQIGKERFYNDNFEGRNDVVHWEVLKIKQHQDIRLKFISVNSKFKQGVRIAVDVGEGYIEVDGDKAKRMNIWQEAAPEIVDIKCVSSEGLLSIYNVWDEGKGSQSLGDPSGMIIEEKDGKLIFSCNDLGFETNFDKLVFQIELLT